MIIIICIIVLAFGIYMLIKGSIRMQLNNLLDKSGIESYNEITGTVVSDAYLKGESKELVTPIVEYKVGNKIYEAQNRVLSLGAELPVGTKVNVWYSKSNPSNVVLGSEINNPRPYRLFGIVLVVYSVLLLMLFL